MNFVQKYEREHGVRLRKATKSECIRKDGRLKKGCVHGGRGDVYKKVSSGLSAVTPAQMTAHFKKHKVRFATKAECQVKSGKRKGKLRKGCFYGRGAARGKIFKKTR